MDAPPALGFWTTFYRAAMRRWVTGRTSSYFGQRWRRLHHRNHCAWTPWSSISAVDVDAILGGFWWLLEALWSRFGLREIEAPFQGPTAWCLAARKWKPSQYVLVPARKQVQKHIIWSTKTNQVFSPPCLCLNIRNNTLWRLLKTAYDVVVLCLIAHFLLRSAVSKG